MEKELREKKEAFCVEGDFLRPESAEERLCVAKSWYHASYKVVSRTDTHVKIEEINAENCTCAVRPILEI